MHKAITSLLLWISAIGILASICWLILIINYLYNTGATYSIDYGQGTMVCGIPIFTQETWLSASLFLFGIPIGVSFISILIGRYGMKRFKKELASPGQEAIAGK